MSSNWPIVRLGDYIDSCLGKMLDKKKNKGTLHTYLGNSNVRWGTFDLIELAEMKFEDSEHKRYGLKYGDLVVCEGGEPGRCAIWESEDEMRIQKALHRIRPNQYLDNYYLYYWFLHAARTSKLEPYFTGTTIKHLTGKALAELPVELPPMGVQQKMGQLLRSFDRKINHNNQTNQTLEQMAQAIFKSWFVDFDPVKAKIETLAAGASADDAELAAMCVISAKTLDELKSLKASNPEAFNKLAQTAALFPAAMQDSELGEIPEGWSVDQLGDHLSVLQTGSRPKGGVGGITEGVPSVGAENILGVGNYTYGKEKFVSREFFDKLKRGVVEDFDFLLYKDGGKPGEFKPRVSMFGCGFPYSEFAINEHVFRMRSESLGQAFLYFQIGHKRVLDELANRGGKAAIPGINQTDVKTIPVLVPGDADLLTEFNEFAKKIIESILKKSKESNHLVAVRDTLLPKLLSGEINLTSEVVV
jgi:type I restriction enzyme S subunit